MKHLRLMSLAAGMLLSLSALPLSAAFAVEAGFYDDLRNSKWHDGFVFYYPENHTPKSQTLKFAGGTMHEGGYEATLTGLNVRNGKVTGGTVAKTEWSPEKKASLVITDDNGMKYSMLYIRDLKGKTINILNPLPDTANTSRLIDVNNVYLSLRGRYLDDEGNRYVFTLGDPDNDYRELPDSSSLTGNRKEACILITPEEIIPLTFEEEFEFTAPVFKLNGIYVEARPTADGLEIHYIPGIDDKENPEGTPKEGIYKKLYPVLEMPRFAFTEEVILNMGLLGHFDYRTLRLMRNEIMARHGYAPFKSQDLRDYFESKPWYNPASDKIQLTPVEKINVDLIRLAEERRKEQEAEDAGK
ncbi:YARHG domain-containing protein [Succinimonas sp.]|uniref:YARHG domain-containing protein n=1 Tax=Succinimonas sp. TaxID=1936151 RepID=UPI003870A3DE